MKKNVFKYVIDAVIFIDFCSIAITGLLLGFVIPKGRGVRSAYRYFLGLHRHEWSNIHLFLSLVLLVLLFFHVWLNRAWIVNSTKSYFGNNWKNILWIFPFGWVVVLLALWAVF